MSAGRPVQFVSERPDEIGNLANVLEQLRLDIEARLLDTRSEADQSATFNKLSALIASASTETELVDAALRAIQVLTTVANGDLQLIHPSQHRLVVAGAWGNGSPAPGTLVEVDRVDRCPGIRRASIHVVPDVMDALALRCDAHPTTSGAVACIPLTALGRVLGVIHIESDVLGDDTVRVVGRVAEQIAVALDNARLVSTLEDVAMTDSLTGLKNIRFFDPYLEQQLAIAERERKPVAVLMLDIDHFKVFNDTHGHPAGDAALRAFAGAVQHAVRASDLVARYGGEEFIVALPNTDLAGGRVLAEKVRAAVASLSVEFGPGRRGQITVSIGVAATDAHGLDRQQLVKLADTALYRAKDAGRNRVEVAPATAPVTDLAAARRRRPGGVGPTRAASTSG
jgi:diguanylate cyclase (GGDEF)-like protein